MTENAGLEAERAVNELYQRKMRDAIARQERIARGQTTTRNQLWTSPGAPSTMAGLVVTPLVGRVALGVDDSLLGRGFYIGPWHQEWIGAQVVSWAAPVASLFYSGSASSDLLARDVTARRTFVVELESIVGFVDDAEPSCREADPFASGAITLTVPVPPSPARVTTEVLQPARPDDQAPSGESCQTTPQVPESLDGTPLDAESTVVPVASTVGLRAETALRTVLERPRSGRLAPVLATLQAEQYRLVTWPDDLALVVQGQPGTGKTIIATHRAAYLTHPERDGGPLHNVALVGPTEEYSKHVGQVIKYLGAEEVRVIHLQQFLAGLADPVYHLAPAVDEQRLDADWRLGRLVERAAAILRDAGVFERSRGNPLRTLVDALARSDALLAPMLAQQPELADWVSALGSFERARTNQRFLPFLASAALAVRPSSPPPFEHLVVDEAQDLRPLEWRVLVKHLRPSAGMTLLGDMNQRRSDWSPETWRQLVIDLDVVPDEDFQPEVLDISFRTTREILRFSNQLLARGKRTVRAIRTGPPPAVKRVSSTELVAAAMRESESLAARHPQGLVAVISVDPQRVSDRFRATGWSRRLSLGHAWARRGHTVLILHPANARGLEFDGVVVVEPADYPRNVGRLGLLYTSLTRAVHELVVVHSRPLPSGLRAERR